MMRVNRIDFQNGNYISEDKVWSNQNHGDDSDNPIHMLEGAGGPWVELTHPYGGDDGQVGADQVVVADSHKVSEPELGLGRPLVQPVHVLEGAGSTWVQLADPDERPSGAVEVVVPDSNWEAKAEGLSGSLVQPRRLLEGAATWVQLVDPMGGPEVMVESVHIVVQDPDSDGKWLGRSLVESVDTLEGACRAGMELADTIVRGKVVSHRAHRGRSVGEPVTRGKEPGLRAPLAHDVEGPATEAGGLDPEPGDSRPGRGESTGTNQHVASNKAGVCQSTGGETGSNLGESRFHFRIGKSHLPGTSAC